MVDDEVSVPNAARMYDWYLGGSQNFAVDRELGARVLERFPHAARCAQANRAFLRRAVRWCVEQGITQFLDLGAGIPTVGNVHEVARALAPDAAVVYVDNEAVAAAHARELLDATEGVAVAQVDLCEPDTVLASAAVQDTLDLTRPIAVLFVAVFHFVGDDADPVGLVSRYREALAPGSVVVISHVSDDQPTEAEAAPHRAVAEVYRHTSTPAHLRDRQAIEALFAGAALVEPGLVDATAWRPDSAAGTVERCGFYAGLARIGPSRRRPAPAASGMT